MWLSFNSPLLFYSPLLKQISLIPDYLTTLELVESTLKIYILICFHSFHVVCWMNADTWRWIPQENGINKLFAFAGVFQLVVAVNKMDTVDWSQERYNEIVKKLGQFLKQAGFKESDVSFVPCSGLSGINLATPPPEPQLCTWYKGATLVDEIGRYTTTKLSNKAVSGHVESREFCYFSVAFWYLAAY